MAFRKKSATPPPPPPPPRTLFEKIWDAHVVDRQDDGTCVIYVDRHLVHEVTSPQAFEGLRMANRPVRRPDATIAVADHNTPTTPVGEGGMDEESRIQVETLEKNVADFHVPYFDMNDARRGIVHVIGPEQGLTLPGMTIVCGDSHTSTHGAFGALAFGIGTSEVEHVLATQTLIQKTVCNMSIEAGARAGLIAPDETTFKYLQGRPYAPKGGAWDLALAQWRRLPSDKGASFDTQLDLNAADIPPMVTWGTSPQDALPITDVIPDPANAPDENRREAWARSLAYMGLTPGTKLVDVPIDRVFIGSCTNGRIEDLRAAAEIARGRKVAPGVSAMVVPGSGLVKAEAEKEGLDKIFLEAGFEWRIQGCSMCLAMNADRLEPGQRCASTSNRNFEGRQGRGGRTHLVSPAMAAAAAIKGTLADVRDYQ